MPYISAVPPPRPVMTTSSAAGGGNVAPPVSKGMQVLLRGSLPLPVAVSLVLSYAPDAESVWVQERIRSGSDVCVYSRDPDILGTIAHEDFNRDQEGPQ